MYTRAKKIGRKVMAGGENNMLKPAASRCSQARAKTKQALMNDWALTDGVTKKWQPEWAATCVICTQEMSAYRLANPQPCRRTAQGTMDTRYGSWDYGKALP